MLADQIFIGPDILHHWLLQPGRQAGTGSQQAGEHLHGNTKGMLQGKLQGLSCVVLTHATFILPPITNTRQVGGFCC
jgi:hypothetical protein